MSKTQSPCLASKGRKPSNEAVGSHSMCSWKIAYKCHFNVFSPHISLKKQQSCQKLHFQNCRSNKISLRYEKFPLDCIIFACLLIQTHHIFTLIKCGYHIPQSTSHGIRKERKNWVSEKILWLTWGKKKHWKHSQTLKTNNLYNGWLLRLVLLWNEKVLESGCVCWEKNILNFRCFFLGSFTISLLFTVEAEGWEHLCPPRGKNSS